MKRGPVVAIAVLLLAALGAALWLALDEGGPAAGSGAADEGQPATGTAARTAAPEARKRVRAGPVWKQLGTGQVTGTVLVYGTSAPLADAEVTLAAVDVGPNRTLSTRTAKDGTFRFPSVPNFDDWTVRVRAPAPLSDVEQAGVSVAASRVTDLGVLYATPAFGVPGIVVDEQGAPIEGAEVRALRTRVGASQLDLLKLIRELPADTPAVDRATTDAEGRFRMTRTSPGVYDFKVLKPGRQVLVQSQVVVTPASESGLLRFVMTRGFALDGRVVRKGPGPVAKIPVVAFREPRDGDFLALDRTYCVTGEDGSFHLDGLAAGQHVVAATPEGEPFTVETQVRVPANGPVELVIEGDAWLEGKVTGKAGAAVAGAQVYVGRFDGKPVVANTRTGADGRYAIRGLKSGKMQLFLVQAEGYATWPTDLMSMFQGGGSPLEVVPGRNERDVSLEVGGTVRGRVVAKDEETPIEGVRVELASVLSMFGGSRLSTTDADGRFEITSAPIGTSMLVLSKDGWFQPGMNPMAFAMQLQGGGKKTDSGKGFVVTIAEPGATVERTLSLARGSTLRGQVLSPAREPVAGARVQLVPETDNDMFGGLSAIFGAAEPRLTDAEGRFEMAGPAPGTKARVVAKAAGYLDGRSEPLVAGIGQTVENVGVRLRLGATVEGRVADAAGLPIEGATVRWLRAEGLKPWQLQWRMRQAAASVTDAEGRYRAEHVEPGKVVVEVGHPRYLPQTFDDVVAEEGKPTTVDAKLALGGVIQGRVLGPDGAARSGARVDLTRADASQQQPFRGGDDGDTTTDAQGAFRAEGLAPGRYTAVARAAGTAPSPAVDVATGETVTLRLLPALRIAGVVRVLGAPAQGVRVAVERYVEKPDAPAAAAQRPTEHAGDAETGADGKFAVDDLPAGQYRVTLESRPWGRAQRANVQRKVLDDVAAGTDALAVELDPGLTITGAVLLADGTIPTQGWVNANLVEVDGKPPERPVHRWDSLEDGTIELVGLPPGRYAVSVDVPGQGRKSVTVDAGTADLKVEVGGGGRLKGRITRDGVGVSGVYVQAQREGDHQAAGTDMDGNYELAGLQGGRYRVEVRGLGGGEVEASADDVEVRVGDVTPLDLALKSLPR